jgi:GNAT superfamily N-acetyltransferase
VPDVIRIFSAAEFEKHIPRFAEILIDAVDSGAGVSFMKPLAKTDAENFWHGQLEAIVSGKTFPIVAEVDGLIVGLVLLLRAWAPNQPHRCDVAKLLVHRNFRRRGVATALMQALEEKAKALNQTLITFDAVAGSPAEAFYKSLGFICVGYYPRYAYSGTGVLDGTALFYKEI